MRPRQPTFMRLCTIALACFALAAATARESRWLPDEARVAAIAAMLSEEPAGMGRPIDDRQAWRTLAEQLDSDPVSRAAADLGTPFPPLTDDFYRAIIESGSRADWYGLDRTRANRLRRFVLAECFEDEGRFLPIIEQALDTLFAETTWYNALHKDRSLANLEGRYTGIDLNVSMRIWELAQADWQLGSRLQPETRRRLREELERRAFAPFRRMLHGEQQPEWWLTTTNNWNAVCLGGVVGAALAVIDSREDRAFFVAAGEKHIRSFLAGFPEDGYCTEGIGYWNYGFGHFLALGEAIHQATQGQVDFLEMPNMRNISLFGVRTEILDGVYPAIADCSPNARPSNQVLHYTSRRLGLGLADWDHLPVNRRFSGRLFETMMHAFPNSATPAIPAEPSDERGAKRSFFDHMGILLCRPGPGGSARLGVCLKGGHNAEHHNHNDVGSFTVAVGRETPIADVGAEVYTHQTFSRDRYLSDALNSYGHSAPVVAGTLQRAGREAEAKVLQAVFTDPEDTLVMDLRAAYDVEGLETLQRTFVYSRAGDGALDILDEVAYAEPRDFEVALLTLGQVRLVEPQVLLFFGEREALRAEIDAGGAELAVRIEDLDATLVGRNKAKRAGIALAQPAQTARVRVRITPARHPYVRPGQAILNGDFAQGLQQWRIQERIPMTSLSSERAAVGEHSLWIVDTSTETGSSALSAPFPLDPEKTYRLRGQWFGVSGAEGGMGVVTRFFDDNDRMLHLPDDDLRLAGTVFVGGDANIWEPFAKTFSPPPGTAWGRIWLHSLNAAVVEGYLDDLELVEIHE